MVVDGLVSRVVLCHGNSVAGGDGEDGGSNDEGGGGEDLWGGNRRQGTLAFRRGK